jgi:tetratricopeptide (TPR) repeat protein
MLYKKDGESSGFYNIGVNILEVNSMNSNVQRLIVHCFCVIIGAVVCFFPRPCTAASQKSDIPLAARVILAKAGDLIDQKAYGRTIDLLTEFQARGGPLESGGKADPKGYHHAEICFVLGTCHLYQENYRQAVPAFEMAVKRDADHISAWLNLAKAYYELENHLRAAQCFAEAYGRSAKKNPEHLYYSAVAFLMAGENRPCIASFEKLLKNHTAAVRPAWLENYIHALIADERPRQALPHIRKLAEQYSGEKQIQWQEILLHQYMQLDMHTQALDYARMLTRQTPARAKWWKALAHIHLQDSTYISALTALTICNYIEPLTGQEKKLLADLHLQVGIPVKAAPLYESALGEKNDHRVLVNLMLALQQLGQPERALEALQRFAPYSKDTELLMLKADMLYSLEQYRESGQVYLQIARNENGQPQKMGRAWLMAGYAALQINDVDAGRQAFQRAAAFKPQRKAALQAIRRLPKS